MIARHSDKELFNRSTCARNTLSVLVVISQPCHLIRLLHLYLNHTTTFYEVILLYSVISHQDANQVTLICVYQSCFNVVTKIRAFDLSHYLQTDATFILSRLWNAFGFSLKPFVQTNITFGDVVIQRVIHYNSKQRRSCS